MKIEKGKLFQIECENRYRGKTLRALQDIDLAKFLEERYLSDFWEVEVELLGEFAEEVPVISAEVDEYWTSDVEDEAGEKGGFQVRTTDYIRNANNGGV